MSLGELILKFLQENGESTVDDIFEELQDYTEKHTINSRIAVLVKEKKVARRDQPGKKKPLFKII
ncbi:MAG: hypothetical protein CM15mV83_170 [uncultured marine virus]|nr:MAG: hypothetical protein CM15mV83_170 [uncultured marine virus]